MTFKVIEQSEQGLPQTLHPETPALLLLLDPALVPSPGDSKVPLAFPEPHRADLLLATLTSLPRLRQPPSASTIAGLASPGTRACTPPPPTFPRASALPHPQAPAPFLLLLPGLVSALNSPQA